MALRTGGRVLVESLKANGADLGFCVPGESYLEVIDALYDERDAFRLIVCRQEGGAAYMAEAYGKLTGRPGLCFVTRGPGATNASIGVHVARQDSTPMIVFVGQIEREAVDREWFQEINVPNFFGSIAKWAAQIQSADRIPEYVARAFHVATSGRQGPVVLGLPEDVLTELCDVQPLAAKTVQAYPSPSDVRQLCDMVARSERPVAIVGGSGWTDSARADIAGFLERSAIPAIAAMRRQSLLDHCAPYYIGDASYSVAPELVKRMSGADLVLAIGTRLNDAVTQAGRILAVPQSKQQLIHIHADPDELGTVYQADLQIASGMPQLGDALRTVTVPNAESRVEWVREGRQEWEKVNTLQRVPANAAYVDLGQVAKYVDASVPNDAVIVLGAGNFAGWFVRYFRFRASQVQLSTSCGSMGSAVPAAVAAKLLFPNRLVVAVSGDGDFMMNGQELATAMQYKLPIVFIVVNNGMYGTIRFWQEMKHPSRVHGTELANPDFYRLAEAYGAHGELVSEDAAFPEAFQRALRADRPALIEVRTNPENINSRTTISALREAHLSKG